MKKLIFILIPFLLFACGKVETNQTEAGYYWQEAPQEWYIPEMPWATSIEILMAKECWITEKFDTQNNKIVSKPYDCEARLWGDSLYKIVKDGMTWFYTIKEEDVWVEWSVHYEYSWELSDKTF